MGHERDYQPASKKPYEVYGLTEKEVVYWRALATDQLDQQNWLGGGLVQLNGQASDKTALRRLQVLVVRAGWTAPARQVQSNQERL